MKYETKVKEVEVVQWTGDNLSEILELCKGNEHNSGAKITMIYERYNSPLRLELNEEEVCLERYIVRNRNGCYSILSEAVLNEKYTRVG